MLLGSGICAYLLWAKLLFGDKLDVLTSNLCWLLLLIVSLSLYIAMVLYVLAALRGLYYIVLFMGCH